MGYLKPIEEPKRFTYRDLVEKIMELSEKQKDSDVTVELALSDEYVYAGELRITDVDHDVLGPDHPVIYVKDY